MKRMMRLLVIVVLYFRKRKQQKPKGEPFRLRTSYGEIIDFD